MPYLMVTYKGIYEEVEVLFGGTTDYGLTPIPTGVQAIQAI